MNSLKNKRGSVPIPTAVLIMVFAVVISAALFIAYVEIQTVVVRNAMNKGLSNLAVTISEDTYAALRESDFDSYAEKLTHSSSYRTELETKYRQDVMNSVDLADENYRVDNIRLDFGADGKRLVYTCTCDVSFYIRLFGQNIPAVARSVRVVGTHTAKYGR